MIHLKINIYLIIYMYLDGQIVRFWNKGAFTYEYLTRFIFKSFMRETQNHDLHVSCIQVVAFLQKLFQVIVVCHKLPHQKNYFEVLEIWIKRAWRCVWKLGKDALAHFLSHMTRSWINILSIMRLCMILIKTIAVL